MRSLTRILSRCAVWLVMASVVLVVGGCARVVVVVGGVARAGVAVPDVTGQPLEAALARLAGLGLTADTSLVSTGTPGLVLGQMPEAGERIFAGDAVRLQVGFGLTDEEARVQAEAIARQLIDAVNNRDVATLVELSPAPFLLDDEIHWSTEEVRDTYLTLLTEVDEPITVSRVELQTAAEIKQRFPDEIDPFLTTMGTGDDDLVAIVYTDGSTSGFYFRRDPDGVRLLGIWS